MFWKQVSSAKLHFTDIPTFKKHWPCVVKIHFAGSTPVLAICIYIYIYIYIYICVYTYVYIYMCIYICAHIYMCTYQDFSTIDMLYICIDVNIILHLDEFDIGHIA